MDQLKLAKVFDLMIWGLTDAGYDRATVHKFMVRARQDLGIPQEDSTKTSLKMDFAKTVSEALNDPPVDGSSEAPEPRKTRRASTVDSPG